MENNNREEFLATGSSTLDALLGGRGLSVGTTVLLRGATGTGKTTMALQMARSAIASQDYAVVFLLFEDVSGSSLDDISSSLFKENSAKEYLLGSNGGADAPLEQQLAIVNSAGLVEKQVESCLKDRQVQAAAEFYVESDDPPEDAFARAEEEYRQLADHTRQVLEQEALRFLTPAEILTGFWDGLADVVNRQVKGFSWGKKILLITDSLNAMTHSLQEPFPALDERSALLYILRSFRSWRGRCTRVPFGRICNATVIFTAESGHKFTNAATSYVADAVIELERKTRLREVKVGSEKTKEWAETLLYCQVSKGRGLAIQRRDACYDFVPESGIQFFPTYAAQGVVSLFQENQPQREAIDSFRDVDVEELFSGVIVHDFERSALQRSYSIRRYGKRVPKRHPLLLASIDEYWVADLRRLDLLYPIPVSALQLYGTEVAQPLPSRIPAAKDPESDDDTESDDARRAETNTMESIIEQIRNKRIYSGEPLFYDETDGATHLYAVPHYGNVGMFVYRHDLLARLDRYDEPNTWQQVEDTCEALRHNNLPYYLLLETATEDSFFTTILELGWANGVVWETRPATDASRNPSGIAVHFQNGEKDFDRFVAAIKRLSHWIHDLQIVPPRSTVDPQRHPKADWAFARHWYSTWVDVITRRDQRGKLVAELKPTMDFRVSEIPIFEGYLRENKDASHWTCWGEWYLAVQNGSENVELGIELINNLLSARKIVERAIHGAGLPLQELFYQENQARNCFGTNLTFSEVRERFLEKARSRTRFYDFRRVAAVLSGALQGVMDTKDVDVQDLLGSAFDRLDPGWRDNESLASIRT